MRKCYPPFFIPIFAFMVISAISSCQENSSITQKTTPQPTSFVDTKGYFRILPPSDWRIEEYRQDPRGKVAFHAPGKQASLRILVKTVDIPDYDALIQNFKEVEQQLGVQTSIEPTAFNKMPAIKRVATITMQGVTQKLLWIDLLIDGVSHNLQYGAPPEIFDKYYEVAWASMLTYEPLKREESMAPEEARKHEAAKWLRLSKIAMEMGNIHAAKEALSAGLEADPKNMEMIQLKKVLEKK